jgi:hypothetical protein
LKVAVTVRFPVRVSVHGLTLVAESHPAQLPKTEEPAGVAVRVRAVPLANWKTHGVGVAQLREF